MDPDSRQEQGWWDAKAAREQRDIGDEAINRALRWREIERRLPGVRTVLSAGTGAGPFTIPLAERGLRVIYLGRRQPRWTSPVRRQLESLVLSLWREMPSILRASRIAA